MVIATNPYQISNSIQSFLSPFIAFDKADLFKSALSWFLVDANIKDALEFIMGSDKDSARKNALSMKSQFVEVEMSIKQLEISDVKDVTGKRVFSQSQRTYGWLVFIDDNILANWGHECRYIFYINDNEMLTKQMLMPPSEKIATEVLG